MQILTVSDLCVGYDNHVVAHDLNFTVGSGDYVCVLGENGAGKSTLIKTLLSLQKPMDGGFAFGGDIKKNEIGYLPQRTEAQKDFPASVREVVMSGFVGKMGFRPFYNKKEREQAVLNMEKVDILPLIDKPFNELSGGQQQRVLLARALCATGRLLILDEPTSGLDPETTDKFYKLVKALAQSGIAVIMISHDPKTATQYATHILHLRNDHCCFGTTSEYVNRHGQWGQK